MKPWAKLALPLLIFFLSVTSVTARSGCCSHHGGVCGCGCCDGTALSDTCAPYYPECNSQPVYVAPATMVPTPVVTSKPTDAPTPVPTPTLEAYVAGEKMGIFSIGFIPFAVIEWLVWKRVKKK